MPRVRHATSGDLDSITEIYNDAILTTVATFDVEPKTIEEQKAWFEDHGFQYPVLVAELNDSIVGWASLSKWSDRCAYADTAEISLYVKKEFRREGIGRKLLEAIMKEGGKVGLHSVIGRIAEGNEISIHLLESVGFEHVGLMREVGRKFGKFLDVYLMQKIYSSSTSPPDGTAGEGLSGKSTMPVKLDS